MTIVVDASVAVKWLVNEMDSDKAESILRDMQKKRLALFAPELLAAEVASFLWKAVWRGGLPAEEAVARYASFGRVCPKLVRISALGGPALRLALFYKRSVYDCLYLALADEVPCDFVTADERFYNAVKGRASGVRLLRDWVQ